MVGTTHDTDPATEIAHEVSIIIPNWNGGEVFRRCCAAIERERTTVDLELVVVDNGSSDESITFLREFEDRHHWVRCVFNRDNLLFAKACNQGYALSRAPWIALINNDVVIESGALRGLLDHGLAHPEVGIVSPRFVSPDGRHQEAYRRLPSALHLVAHYHRLGRGVDRCLLGNRIGDHYFYRDIELYGAVEVEQAGASCNLFLREAIESAGGLMDEGFPLLFNDVDLYHRILSAGYRSHAVTSVRVVHHDAIASHAMPQAVYWHHCFDGMFRYIRKHRPAQLPWLISAWPLRWWSSRAQK
jgi:GT2 family glycosyltransferase